jgi:hypothetical protein
MKIRPNIFALFIVLICTIASGCSHKNKGETENGYEPSEPSVFTHSPVELSKLTYLLSLGWLQPVGHTIPTDHVYFWFNGPSSLAYPVYAPGGGKIQFILKVPAGGINECKVWIKMNSQFSYYLDHIVLNSDIKQETVIKAGQQIGTTGLGNSIDLGVIDNTITNAFANPLRYVDQTLHCGKPFSYFTEPLKSQFYALVDREGTEKDGWVNTDVIGHLSGNWFLDDGNFYKDDPNGWDKELAFAYDIQRPSIIMVSIGGVVCPPNKFSLLPGVIKPADVTPANGKVAYPLWSIDPNPPHGAAQRGLMLVQMMDDKHIKVQVTLNTLAQDGIFDSSARMYAR